MIDFTGCIEYANKYEGSEKKKTIKYNGKRHLLKFPDPIRERNKTFSYVNNTISEYIGCKIYDSVGIETQKVILGAYQTDKGETKIVCACEDFTGEGMHLYEYKRLQLANVEEAGANNLELDKVVSDISANPRLRQVSDASERFWDMFVVDTFIGNPDRHTGNWGFLGTDEQIKQLAPVFDCGSCLFPLMGDEEIKSLPKSEYKNHAINVYSCYRENGRRIHAANYIISGKNPECNEAVKRILRNLDLQKVLTIIDDMDQGFISKERKDFYKEVLNIRYQYVLVPALRKIQQLEMAVQKDNAKSDAVYHKHKKRGENHGIYFIPK